MACLLAASPAAAQQRIDPGGWFDALDLPRALLPRIGASTKLVLDVAVGADGAPLACTIAETSGLAELDALTCRLIARRARFIPRRDDAGMAVAGSNRVKVDWRLLLAPASTPGWAMTSSFTAMLARRFTFSGRGVPAAGRMRIVVAITENRVVTDCTITQSSGSADYDAWFCRKVMAARPFSQVIAAGVAPTAARGQLSVRWDTAAASYGSALEVLAPLTAR